MDLQIQPLKLKDRHFLQTTNIALFGQVIHGYLSKLDEVDSLSDKMILSSFKLPITELEDESKDFQGLPPFPYMGHVNVLVRLELGIIMKSKGVRGHIRFRVTMYFYGHEGRQIYPEITQSDYFEIMPKWLFSNVYDDFYKELLKYSLIYSA